MIDFFRFFTALILTILVIILVGLFLSYESRNTPTALNVYQGKTILEYKVVDDVKVDSVVIF